MGRLLALPAALAVVLLTAAAGPATAASTRAVGATDVNNPGWVVQVEATYPSGSGAFCGGELIAKTWVLTAGHCVTDETSGQTAAAGSIRVWVGLNRRSDATGANAQAVDRVVVDPAYAPATSYGDLALLHLAAADPHPPVALAGATEPFVGSTATVLGWGVTVPLLNISSDTLQQVGAPILDTSTCAAYGAMYDAGTMICAGAVVGHDSCNGDSGGPLAYQPLGAAASLVGTVDYGSELCGDGSPSVYQRVTSGPAAQWLAATVPTAAIDAPAGPPKNATVTATAAATNLPNPAFAWDLDGNGDYGDATGPTVSVHVGSAPQEIGLRVTGSDGDQAARRVTLVPLDTTVRATVPARVTEGRALAVALATTGPGQGTVTARATGAGISATATAAVPGARSLALSFPNDHVWTPPRRVAVALSAGGGVALVAPTTAHTTIVDDDRPVVRITRVTRGTSRLTITARPPGSGTFTVRLVSGRSTVARRAVRVHGTRTARFTLSTGAAARRALARGGARVRISWRSSSSPAATATAQRAVR